MPKPAAQDPNEPLPVVDAQDRVVGQAPRWRIHRDGLRHRAVHVIVLDGRGRVYLQLRSAAKDSHPGQWTSSASGHVDPCEGYDAAARRELGEELGLDLTPTPVGRLAAGPATDNEFTAVYLLTTDQPPSPNPVEIAEGRWFTPAEALALAADPAQAVPALEPVLRLALAGAGASPP